MNRIHPFASRHRWDEERPGRNPPNPQSARAEPDHDLDALEWGPVGRDGRWPRGAAICAAVIAALACLGLAALGALAWALAETVQILRDLP